MNYNHPAGNLKIKIIKCVKQLFENTILFFAKTIHDFKSNEKIIISSAIYAKWEDDIEFKKYYEKFKDFTLLDHPRAYTLWYFCKNLKNIKGDILDIGCLNGGSGFILSRADTKNKVKLFDTFEGHPIEDQTQKKNMFVGNYPEIVKNIKRFNLKNILVFKSRFPKNIKNIKKIKLCHIDINLYYETKNAFYYVDKYLIKNGVIIFDDYGIWKADGIKKFIHQLEKKYQKKYHFIYNYMGQCILIKK